MNLKKTILYFTILSAILLNNFTYIYSADLSSQENTSESVTEAPVEPDPNDPLGLTAEAAILIDAKTGIVLYEKNPDEKLYPASITKIMTALLILEYGKLDDVLTHSHEAIYGIGPGSSHIGMREGEQITLLQGLYGILLASANEVCVAAAEHIDGSEDAFVERMNKKAEELGAKNTHFVNPHGYHDNDHYTTARDMSVIMREAVKQEKFIELISTYTYTIPPTNIVNEQRVLHNTNKLINPYNQYRYEPCIGGKTGFTDEAGNNLVTYAEKDGISLISVLMKDKGTTVYTDTKALLEYGFNMFQERKISARYTGITTAIQNFHDKKVDLGKISVIPGDSITVNVPQIIDKNNITYKINLNSEIEAPIEIGNNIGTIDVIYKSGYGDHKIGEINLISNTKAELIPEEELIKQENFERFLEKALNILKIGGIIIAAILIIIFIMFFLKRRSSKKQRRGGRNIRFK